MQMHHSMLDCSSRNLLYSKWWKNTVSDTLDKMSIVQNSVPWF